MSAYVIIRQPEAVHVLTDGLGYDAGGTVARIEPKCFQLGAMPAVVTGRGAARIPELVATMAAMDGGDFDGFLARLPDHMERIEAGLKRKDMATDFEVIVAGWSPAQERFAVYGWDHHGRYHDRPAMALVEIPAALWMAPMPAEADLLAAGWNPGMRWEDFDVTRDGQTIMEAQRRVRSLEGDLGGPGQFLVGGHVLQSTVTRDGVSERIIRRWNDAIGEKVRPELLTVGGPAGNRQQRRAAKAERRRAA